MRGTYVDIITRHMAVLSSRVAQCAQQGRMNINVDTEMTICGLLNLLEGWELHSLNDEVSNYPAIDLADKKNRIAVQITSTATNKKVNHTLEGFFGNGLQKHFDRLIIFIICDKKCPSGEVRTAGKFRFDPAKDIWNVTTVSNMAKVLPDAEKLRKIAEYLDSELGKVPSGPRFPLPGVPLSSGEFLEGSRNRELDELEDMVKSGRPVFLWGVGGIGKTEVAIQLAQRVSPDRKVYFLNYCQLPESSDAEALRETILRANFTGYRYRGTDNEQRDNEFRERMDMLRTDYAGSMLIIDNFDREGKTLANLQNEPAYRELTAMDICLVFTTRSSVKDGCEIKPLDDELLLSLMQKKLESVNVEEEKLRRLIRAVDGHTLMVLLMAKTLEESWGDVTPELMLSALQGSELKRKDFPEIISDQNQSYEQKQIYAHIKALFDLSGMHAVDHTVLRCATLLPEEGMERTLFLAALPAEHRQHLRNLVSRGWLRLDKNLLTIHPVIRGVCREELVPTDRNCKAFLINLYKQYTPKRYNARLIWQAASCLSIASEKLEDFWGDWSFDAARLWSEVGQSHIARQYAEKMLARRELRHKRSKPYDRSRRKKQLASGYNMAAIICSHSGQYEQARIYGETALKLRRECLPDEDPLIATSFNNLGMTYSHLGNYDLALSYLWKALHLREAQEQPRKDEIANTYNNIGTVYYSMEEYPKALTFRQRALDIRREIYGNDPENPDLVTAINNVGRTLHELGRYEDALKLEQEALALRKKTLHKSDSDLANSYYNVGHTQAAMGRYREAVENLENALRTWELGNAQGNIYFQSTQQELAQYRALLTPQGV